MMHGARDHQGVGEKGNHMMGFSKSLPGDRVQFELAVLGRILFPDTEGCKSKRKSCREAHSNKKLV